MQQQPARPSRLLASPARHDRRPAGVGLVDAGLDPDLLEQPRDVLGGLALPRPGVVPEVGGVDPDQVATQVHDLGLDPLVGMSLGHVPEHVTAHALEPSGDARARALFAIVPGALVRVAELADALA